MRRRPRAREVLDAATRAQVTAELAALRGGLPDCRTALLCSVEGLVIASDTDTDAAVADLASLGAAAADLAAQGRRTSASVGTGEVAEVAVRTAEGSVAVHAAGPFAILAVVAGPGGNLALSHLAARRAAARLTEVVRLPAAR